MSVSCRHTCPTNPGSLWARRRGLLQVPGHCGNLVQCTGAGFPGVRVPACSLWCFQSTGLTYRNGVVECPASPSSPLSQQSYSPSQSPSNLSPSVVSGSPFSDPYYPPQSPQQQQQQQQQANALQHRFEQFNMVSGRVTHVSASQPA